MPAWAAGNTKLCKVTKLQSCVKSDKVSEGVWDGTVSYLEVKDDGPDEPKGELGVAIHNVLSSDVDKFDLFVT